MNPNQDQALFHLSQLYPDAPRELWADVRKLVGAAPELAAPELIAENTKLRTVAMLAQGVVDESGRWGVTMETINLLREALTRIKKSPDSACVQKDSREEHRTQPPEAGQEQAGSPS